MEKPEVTYFCNKCGYFGQTSEHAGCNYFACTSLTQQWADQLEAENARLREENKAFESDVETIAAHNIELQEQLAAAQATIAQMREKSEAAKNACMVASSGCSHIKTHAECNEARQFAHATKINVETTLSALNEAIAIPTNLDALHEARAQALEAAVKEFHPAEQFFGIEVGDMLMLQAAAHRARKEEEK